MLYEIMDDHESFTPNDQYRPYVRPPTPEWFRRNPMPNSEPAESMLIDIPMECDPVSDADDRSGPSTSHPGTPSASWNHSDAPGTPGSPPLTDDDDYDDGRSLASAPGYYRGTPYSALTSTDDHNEDDIEPSGQTKSPGRRDTSPLSDLSFEDIPEPVILNPTMDRMTERMHARVFEYNSEGESEVEEAESDSEAEAPVAVKKRRPAAKVPNRRRNPVNRRKPKHEDNHARTASAPALSREMEVEGAASQFTVNEAVSEGSDTGMMHVIDMRNGLDIAPDEPPMRRDRRGAASKAQRSANTVADAHQTTVGERVAPDEPPKRRECRATASKARALARTTDTPDAVTERVPRSAPDEPRKRRGPASKTQPSATSDADQTDTGERVTCLWDGCGEQIALEPHRACKRHFRDHLFGLDKKDEMRCKWVNCSKRMQVDNLPRHIMTGHLGSEDYACSVCGTVLRRKDALTRHKRSCPGFPQTMPIG